MKKRSITNLSAMIAGTAIGVLGSHTASAEAMFECEDLGSGAELRTNLMEATPTGFMSPEAKCGEGTCGEKKDEAKSSEHKCGEGKCGESKSDVKAEKSASEAKAEGKATEHKCGEGKCGESKSDAKSEKTKEADPQ